MPPRRLNIRRYISGLIEDYSLLKVQIQNIRKDEMRIQRDRMLRRVFRDGIASDGKLINSNVSIDEDGVYSRGHGKKRRARGKQNELMDLNFTGFFKRPSNWKVETDRIRVVAGKPRRLKLAHEEFRKKRIFAPTREERQRMNTRLVNRTSKLIQS